MPRPSNDPWSDGSSDPFSDPWTGTLTADWAAALEPVRHRIDEASGFLRAERSAGRAFLPAGPVVLRAFSRPLADVRVVVVGQDPYPTPGHAVGLAFSVAPSVRPVPRSLRNIFAERQSDLGVPPAESGDLSGWFDQGVLLLNRVLTVEPGRSGSHRGVGWEAVTAQAVQALIERRGPLVAVLWGREAQSLAPLLGPVPVIASAHPSPLSARNGFFGSRPFSRVNQALESASAAPIDWARSAG